MEMLLAASAAALAAVITFILMRGSKKTSGIEMAQMIGDFQREIHSMKSAMQEQSLELGRRIEDQMSRNTAFLHETHKGYLTAVGELHQRLGDVQNAARSIHEIGKDIASLQDILKSPKLRGGLGELLLAELLRQVLPEDHFSLQYSFKTGSKVDAVIKLGAGLIPVDAKFPLENFRRLLNSGSESPEAKQARRLFAGDVKKHIDSICQKYILPEEGTFDFALMYIPAENVYYELIIKEEHAENLCEYAWERKVIPVSPGSFYAYLEAIVRGLKGLRIERSAQLILESLGQIEVEFKKAFDEFEKLGTHLSHAQTAYDRTSKRFQQMGARLSVVGEKKEHPDEPSPGLSRDPQTPLFP